MEVQLVVVFQFKIQLGNSLIQNRILLKKKFASEPCVPAEKHKNAKFDVPKYSIESKGDPSTVLFCAKTDFCLKILNKNLTHCKSFLTQNLMYFRKKL